MVNTGRVDLAARNYATMIFLRGKQWRVMTTIEVLRRGSHR